MQRSTFLGAVAATIAVERLAGPPTHSRQMCETNVFAD
jgi:hypothetical protein